MRLFLLGLIAAGLASGVVAKAYAAEYPLAHDVSTIDQIVDAYYEVISGPIGHQYDAARDRSLHAPDAVITRTASDGFQRHDLATEQKAFTAPYAEGLFEVEIGRIVQQYENLAQVWSTFEIRNTPDGETVSRGVTSMSLYYRDNRWWIANWSTQAEDDEPLPDKYLQLHGQ